MSPIIFADLDDTIFTTMKSYPGHDPEKLLRVTTAKNENHSYMCDSRIAILKWLTNGATLIPVTARSLDAYRRVSLSADYFLEGAVLSNGALILDSNGVEDQEWSARVKDLCEDAEPVLERGARAIEAAPCNVRILRHMHNGVMLGMTVKSNLETDTGVILNLGTAELTFRNAFPRTNVAVHRNGNNLAFVPGGVSKREAVQYLLNTRDDLQGRTTIGAGDSLADLPFIELCDMAIIPAKTQNAAKLFAKTREVNNA